MVGASSNHGWGNGMDCGYGVHDREKHIRQTDDSSDRRRIANDG